MAIALEGAAYALAPDRMKAFLASIHEKSPDQLRLAGLFALVAGVALVWLVLER